MPGMFKDWKEALTVSFIWFVMTMMLLACLVQIAKGFGLI